MFRVVGIAFCAGVGIVSCFRRVRGVINDPDGYVNVRADKRLDAPVVAIVRKGQPFSLNVSRTMTGARYSI